MGQTGILIHVYHLEAKGWESFVWGSPEKNQLGTLPKLVELVLTEASDEPVTAILIYSGPSTKDGLSEGAYTKRYLLEHFDALSEFPTLKHLFDQLTSQQKAQLKERLSSQIIVGPVIRNTDAEIACAADEFKSRGIKKVIQLAVATHAPRCMQKQLLIRGEGIITPDEIWSVVASDTHFPRVVPSDIVVFEPPHRGDDPMIKLDQTPPQVMKEFYKLDPYKKQHFIAAAKKMFKDYEDQRL